MSTPTPTAENHARTPHARTEATEADPAEALARAVAHATGGAAQSPRDSQAILSGWITEALDPASGAQHLSLQAPTGSGKTLSYLVPAFCAAATRGERTLISTQGLGLQRQILHKDAPAAAQAVFEATGADVRTTVLKGFGNYVCLSKAKTAATEVLGTRGSADAAMLASRLRAEARGDNEAVTVLGVATRFGAIRDLLVWALEDPAPGTAHDRDDCPVALGGNEWQIVSLSAQQCAGEKCPLFDHCAPQNARRDAAESDVVVTNHTMLAIQAAKKVPVVIGNKTLGPFDHVIIDEAHSLPGVIRSHGAVEITEARLRRLAGRIEKESAPIQPPTWMQNMTADLREAAAGAMDDVAAALGSAGLGQEKRLESEDTFSAIHALQPKLAELKEPIRKASSVYDSQEAQELIAGISQLVADIDSAASETTNVARWLIREKARSGEPVVKLCASPVDVSSDLYFTIYTADDESGADGDDQGQLEVLYDALDDETLDPDERSDIRAQIAALVNAGDRRELNVVAVSATLSPSFTAEAGLRTRTRSVETPFAAAYAASAAYTPTPVPEDIAEIGVARGKKIGLDTAAHVEWCTEQIAELVYANSGAAMIISATASAARRYAEALRADESIDYIVYDQWDPRGTAAAIEAWRTEESSVIVGTRSLMTGVDAPGATNSLVIVDRPPRAPMNPVDKARADALIAAGEKWYTADAKVYVEDASVLLEQALGRLIRAQDDTGMAVVLDPRLTKGSEMAYGHLPRSIYTKALAPYGQRFDHLDEALDWLEAASPATAKA